MACFHTLKTVGIPSEILAFSARADLSMDGSLKRMQTGLQVPARDFLCPDVRFVNLS